MRRRSADALTIVPAAALAASFGLLAWREQGSIVAEDWLAYALAAGLMAATVVASGAFRPLLPCFVGLGGLGALALWTALSASWSPVPALARDEALLVLFYGLVLAVPLLTLQAERERLAAIALTVGVSVTVMVATAVQLVTDEGVADLYWHGRLASPIGYPGAEAALFLVSFWPAVALAASRGLPLPLRALAFGGVVALLGGLLMTQSRAAAVSLALSAIVVFALAPSRLRLLVPVLLAAALVGPSYYPLTEPFRAEDAALGEAIGDAGRWALVLFLVGTAVGVLYALADRHVALPPRLVAAFRIAALAAVVVAAACVLGGFFVAVEHPVAYVGDRWGDFKREPDRETGSSHFVTLGSNRYDLWRVALREFREHPLAGAGARSFGSAYLREGRTDETPQRGHSIELDLLAETGLVGLVLLALALSPFAWIVIRRARSDILRAAILGGVTYWFLHASVDWTWTFPAAALPFLLLLGAGSAGSDEAERLSADVSTGLSRRTHGQSPHVLMVDAAESTPKSRRMAARAALPAGLALAGAAVILFTPPWLSTRYTARALEGTYAEAADELRWARRFDPLSVKPLVAEAELAPSPEQAIPPLEEAVEQEPRSIAPRYLLGVAYLDAGRLPEARRELREALRLAPRSAAVQRALRRATEAARGP